MKILKSSKKLVPIFKVLKGKMQSKLLINSNRKRKTGISENVRN